MSYRIKLIWKLVVDLGSGGIIATSEEHGLLFNRKSGRSFLNSIGGNFKSSYTPIVLQPTDAFHQALNGLREKLKFEGNRFPVKFNLTQLDVETRLNVALHLYGTSVCATFSLDEFTASADIDLLDLQNLYSHQSVWKFISKILAITITGDRNAKCLAKSVKFYPCIQVVSQSEDLSSWRDDMAGLVTRHPEGALIFETVRKKNQSHQIDNTLLLFDRQGVVGYVPFGSSKSSELAHSQRFRNATSMIEYSAMLQRQLERLQWLPEDLRQCISQPQEAVPNSVSARYIWSLAVKEFSLQTGLKDWEKSFVQPVTDRILVVTVTPVESAAIHTVFQRATKKTPEVMAIDGYRYQNLGRLGCHEIFHSISGMGTGGVAGAQESIRRSIDAIRPSAVIMVGIAFGIDRDKQKVGQVLVSRQILMYELQRINNDLTITSRGDKITASPKLLDWVSHSQITWDSEKANIQTGLILSGEKLVDNLPFRERLKDLAPEVIGGEMEAAGLYVACQTANIDWLVVKAICDWADGDKGTEKETNQKIAASAAAEFVLHMLSSG